MSTLPELRVDPRRGSIVGERYRIGELIARGSMGAVYRAERTGLGRTVAIKFLVGGCAPEDELRRRFEIEAKAASRLGHPNCVGVIDFGLDRDTPFVVMEFVDGETLRAVLRRSLPSVGRALRLSRQLLAGLAHAHEHGVVHRDIKPDNVLVSEDAFGEHLKLTDFGLAKIDTWVTNQRFAIGTPSYMSPEQTIGDPVDARADVYAMGVLLFELLTGHKPFRADTPFETMRLHREAPIPCFEDVAPDRPVSPTVEGVVRRALAKRREDRYGSAIELAKALERAVEVEDDDQDLGKLLAASRGSRGLFAGIAFCLVMASIALIVLLALVE